MRVCIYICHDLGAKVHVPGHFHVARYYNVHGVDYEPNIAPSTSSSPTKPPNYFHPPIYIFGVDKRKAFGTFVDSTP